MSDVSLKILVEEYGKLKGKAEEKCINLKRAQVRIFYFFKDSEKHSGQAST